MPSIFVSHGSPTLALDRHKGADFARWARSLPRPRAIVVVSAHWELTPVTIGTTRDAAIVHDFFGFPDELYTLHYDAPGAPDLARDLAQRLDATLDERRPRDHGAWVPLMHMYPRADVPVLQISLPSRAEPSRMFELGRALAPLRDDGVLLMGSGGAVHNLRTLDWNDGSPPAKWAVDFDRWLRDTLIARDWPTLIAHRTRSPSFDLAHPTPEHFLPILVAAGAGSLDTDAISFPIEGFEFGSLGRRGVQFG